MWAADPCLCRVARPTCTPVSCSTSSALGHLTQLGMYLQDCWDYLHANKLEHHPLHDQGFPSIGDVQTTVPVPQDQWFEYAGERKGRFQGLDRTECGIHQPGEFRAGCMHTLCLTTQGYVVAAQEGMDVDQDMWNHSADWGLHVFLAALGGW